ncbi:hypothetical protein TWF730_002924 [Orbilia blumenaviensis]|uniref:FHA domain-containing protein n=1 Tax=Orbilia blumenaviensis TaxID=1796055 RepID=A0AAV9U7B6_9PEZI
MASMPLENIAEVILTPTDDVPDSVGTRSIPITRKEPLITVGRSSRNKTKNLQPDRNNAYFDSPVMSRLHSWIKCDEEGKVLISDAGSMHGTYLDDKRLEPRRFVLLETGSQVRFGNSVTRGADVYPPKAFDVKVVQNSRMAEIHHGYGITSDELVLPDSPYYSSEDEDDEVEDDDVVITEVKPINTVDLTSTSDRDNDWDEEVPQKTVPGRWGESGWVNRANFRGWPGASCPNGRPSEESITIIRENIREPVCIDLDPPVVRDPHVVDLTAETPILQQSKLPGARISIPDLLAQERREQSRRSPQARDIPLSNERAAISSVDVDSDTQSVGDYDPSDSESADEDSVSGVEAAPESAPTSPFSPEPIKASITGLPSLPPMQSSMPALVKEIVPPEVQKAWNSTWTAAPFLSPFVYAGGTPPASDSKPLDVTTSLTMSRDSITNLANRTKLAMEQVRKAEAMRRDRAQEFLRSRIEMQFARSHKPPTELGPNPGAQVSPDDSTAKSDPDIPTWVRNFGQGMKTENKVGPEAEQVPERSSIPNTEATLSQCVPSHSETRSPSPVLKMAGNYQESDDEEELEFHEEDDDDDDDDDDEEEEEEEEEEDEEEQDSDGDSWMEKPCHAICQSSDSEVSDKEGSEDVSDDEVDDDVLEVPGGFLPTEDDDYDNEDDVDEDLMEFDGDTDGHDTESSPSDDDDIAEGGVILDKGTKNILGQNPVKNAMSMENFFSPKDEEEVRSSQEDEIVKRWNAEIEDLFSTQPDLEIGESNDTQDILMADPDLLPPANKKRKRSESEEAEEYPHYSVASELEALEISTPRKIAPLPQRFLTRTGQNNDPAEVQNPREEAERKELLALASELKSELEAEAAEPEAKRPRIQNAGPTWGSTIATAMAGAFIGGVGVFAALVATAGDI